MTDISKIFEEHVNNNFEFYTVQAIFIDYTDMTDTRYCKEYIPFDGMLLPVDLPQVLFYTNPRIDFNFHKPITMEEFFQNEFNPVPALEAMCDAITSSNSIEWLETDSSILNRISSRQY